MKLSKRFFAACIAPAVIALCAATNPTVAVLVSVLSLMFAMLTHSVIVESTCDVTVRMLTDIKEELEEIKAAAVAADSEESDEEWSEDLEEKVAREEDYPEMILK